MTTTTQILLGAALLSLCSLLHIFVLISIVRLIRHHAHHLSHMSNGIRWAILLLCAFAAILLSHTIQVWSWASAFVGLGALQEIDRAIYFALVTYTTVGYGDVTVGESHRIFAAMASVTGLLNFALSAALLVGMFTHMLGEQED